MEYGLRLEGDVNHISFFRSVLILILLEYGLRLSAERPDRSFIKRLNPYSIGIWSATPYATDIYVGYAKS